MWSPRARMAYWRVVLVGVPAAAAPADVGGARGGFPPSAAPIAASVDVVATPAAPAWPASAFTETVSAGSVAPFLWADRRGRSARRGHPPAPGLARSRCLHRGAPAPIGPAALAAPAVGRPGRDACGDRRRVPRVGDGQPARDVRPGLASGARAAQRSRRSPSTSRRRSPRTNCCTSSRADWVRNALDEVMRAVLWFHPGIWFVINQIQLAREQVVDREAVRRLGTGSRISRRCSAWPGPRPVSS